MREDIGKSPEIIKSLDFLFMDYDFVLSMYFFSTANIILFLTSLQSYFKINMVGYIYIYIYAVLQQKVEVFRV